jgi:hypothetical protein
MLTIHRKGEELPRAYVVKRADQKVEVQDIHEFMNSRVARHKRLAGGIVFLDAIPKNPVSAAELWMKDVY